MIGIITYDTHHRKTQDLIYHLILNGYSNLHLIVIPWIKRENHIPIYEHRPLYSIPIEVEDFCNNLGLKYTRVKIAEIEQLLIEKQFEHIIIGGSGLLPYTLPKNFEIINAHPGYLPNVRGLDALKWAIYLGQPIGVTTHYISESIDEGRLIERKIVPVYFEDTFHSVAYRVFEKEIEMSVNAIKLIENNEVNFEDLSDSRYKVNRRMPHHLEMIMIKKFEEIRKNSESQRTILQKLISAKGKRFEELNNVWPLHSDRLHQRANADVEKPELITMPYMKRRKKIKN